jgi:cell division protein FtsX
MPGYTPFLAHGSLTQLGSMAGYVLALIGLSVGLVVAGVRLRRRESQKMRRLGTGLLALGFLPASAIAIATLISLLRHGSA